MKKDSMHLLKKLYRILSPAYQVLYPEYKMVFAPRYGHGKPPHKQLYSIINGQRPAYAEHIKEMTAPSLLPFIHAIGDKQGDYLPKWENGFFPPFDMMTAYAMLAIYKPGSYIEVGSGNSTKVAALAKKEQNLSTRIISLDPHPRAEIDQLADKIIRKPFESAGIDFILSLKENDILFIDNSHRIFPNSDSTVFYLEVLPFLSKGVIVHIHDVFLPCDYPQEQCDRFYSEQYGLAICLMAQPERYQAIFPNYFISEDKDLSALADPLWNTPALKRRSRHGGSFWLKIG